MDLVNSVFVPVVIGLVEVIKRIGLPNRFLPLVAVFLGFGASYLFPLTKLEGIIVGLMAVGLYSSVKNSMVK